MYSHFYNQVLIRAVFLLLFNKKLKELKATIGLKQRCVLNPALFSVVSDWTIKEAKKKMKTIQMGCWQIEQIEPKKLIFADEMALIVNSDQSYDKIWRF